MSFNQILDFVKTYLADYLNMISVVFTRPHSLHRESVDKYGEEVPALVVATLTPPLRIKRLTSYPTQLAINLLISLVLGSFLFRPDLTFSFSVELGVGLLLGMLFWLLYSFIVFSVFKLLKGKLNFLEFAVVCLQIVASVYMVSSILSFLSAVFLPDFLFFSISLPVIIYVVVQSILLVWLLSISLRDFIS